jgi:hypothetical protein
VIQARHGMINHPDFVPILSQLIDWPGYPLKRHNDAGHPIHLLSFLAELGWRIDDPGMAEVVERIMAQPDPDGPFQVIMNIHPRYGGLGKDQLVWMLCDTPLILFSLLKLGLADDQRVQKAGQTLMALIRDNGWPCAVKPSLGRFRGPGRKSDPCPYATLVMLKALAQLKTWHDDPVTGIGAETLLSLWSNRKERRPYLFAMGTHFSRLKAPLIWYDILHVLDVLSLYPDIRADTRFIEMLRLLQEKTDGTGRYTPESIWQAWRPWEFSQKREPSYWITFLVHRIVHRVTDGRVPGYENK